MPACPSKLARSRNWGTLAATDWSHRASTLSTPRIRVRDAAWSPLLRAANERSCSTTFLRRLRSIHHCHSSARANVPSMTAAKVTIAGAQAPSDWATIAHRLPRAGPPAARRDLLAARCPKTGAVRRSAAECRSGGTSPPRAQSWGIELPADLFSPLAALPGEEICWQLDAPRLEPFGEARPNAGRAEHPHHVPFRHSAALRRTAPVLGHRAASR